MLASVDRLSHFGNVRLHDTCKHQLPVMSTAQISREACASSATPSVSTGLGWRRRQTGSSSSATALALRLPVVTQTLHSEHKYAIRQVNSRSYRATAHVAPASTLTNHSIVETPLDNAEPPDTAAPAVAGALELPLVIGSNTGPVGGVGPLGLRDAGAGPGESTDALVALLDAVATARGGGAVAGAGTGAGVAAVERVAAAVGGAEQLPAAAGALAAGSASTAARSARSWAGKLADVHCACNLSSPTGDSSVNKHEEQHDGRDARGSAAKHVCQTHSVDCATQVSAECIPNRVVQADCAVSHLPRDDCAALLQRRRRFAHCASLASGHVTLAPSGHPWPRRL